MQFFLYLLSFLTTVYTSNICRALVLEAGADLGAYEAGVILGLVNTTNTLYGSTEQVEWDVFSGVSVGSINSAYLNMFNKNETLQMADSLVQLWLQIKQKNVFQEYEGGLLQGLLFDKSLLDTQPLENFISNQLVSSQKRKLNFAATNANTGSYDRFYENTTNITQAIMSSAAVPVVFPYQEYNGQTYLDGGVISYLDIAGAIKRCREIVQDDSQISLDIVMISPQFKNQTVPENATTTQIYRYQENIRKYEKNLKTLIEAYEYFTDVNFRYVLCPKTFLPGYQFPFFFNKNQTQEMINKGYCQAEEQVKNQFQVKGKNSRISEDVRQLLIRGYEYEFDKYMVNYTKTTSF